MGSAAKSPLNQASTWFGKINPARYSASMPLPGKWPLIPGTHVSTVVFPPVNLLSSNSGETHLRLQQSVQIHRTILSTHRSKPGLCLSPFSAQPRSSLWPCSPSYTRSSLGLYLEPILQQLRSSPSTCSGASIRTILGDRIVEKSHKPYLIRCAICRHHACI